MSALRRSGALLVPVVLFTLFALAPAARAEERAARVEAALHHGAIGKSSLAWSSTFVLDLGADQATASEPWRVRLATPLPDGETLTGPEGVSAITEGGRIVGLHVDGTAVSGRALTISLEQPIGAHPGRLHLGAPLAAGDALQIIEVVGEDGARFEPDATLGLERRVGYFAPHALDGQEREACERRLGYRPRRRDSTPLYVRAESSIALRGGIEGALVTHSERVRGG